MSKHWWRAYDEALEDPKLGCLSDESFRFWFNLCCVCSKFGGNLPGTKHIAFLVKMQERKVIRLLENLEHDGLIDKDDQGVRPHNWEGRQYKSDGSAERMRRHRYRHRDVTKTVTVTPPDTDTESETESERKNGAGAPPFEESGGRVVPFPEPDESLPSKYAFTSGIIRLTHQHYAQWTKAYPNLNLDAELIALTPWAERQGNNWFHAVSGALTKRQREITARIEIGRQQTNANNPYTRPL